MIIGELSIKPVQVQGPFGIERNFDICLNGLAIKGARYDTREAARIDLEIMLRKVGFNHVSGN